MQRDGGEHRWSTSEPRDAAALMAAVALHVAAAIVSDGLAPEDRRAAALRRASQPDSGLVEVALELDLDETGARSRFAAGWDGLPGLGRQGAASGVRESALEPRRRGGSPDGTALDHSPEAAAAAGEPRDAPTDLGDWSDGRVAPPYGPGGYGPPPVVGAVPGPGAGSVWALPGVLPPDRGAPAPTAAPRRRYDRDAAGKVLRSELRKRDAQLGLVPPAASAAADALRVAVRHHTPAVSRATFQARFDASGQLAALEVLSFSAGTAQQWRRAAAEARARLRGRSFPMRGDFATGARVTIHLRSVMQYPSGSGRKPDKRKPIEAPRWPFTPRSPPAGRSFRTPPWGPPPEDGVVARGDVSDIGAQPRRVIYAHTESQPL